MDACAPDICMQLKAEISDGCSSETAAGQIGTNGFRGCNIGDLKKISDIAIEERESMEKLAENLKLELECKKSWLEEMVRNLEETGVKFTLMVEEKDKLGLTYDEGDHFRKILIDHEKVKSQLVAEREKLELREQELAKCVARYENDMKMLAQESERGFREIRSSL
ncbi:hypothetical protein Tsubulata_012521 [Turnera subulata]|uniref:Uncharacterized protein n=1 Tax=Turnera subulata TaxID=218843 RepID=A0A9Q0F5E9_9ROSI|nr:hypothetical protein Tsubulata_012521 [Turnera subulata]